MSVEVTMRQSFKFSPESHVSSAEYDPGDPAKGVDPVLTLQFKKGGVYAYKNVPQELADRIGAEARPGAIIEHEVKGVYQHEKLA
jgi:hypothetical protein